jgi:predicted acetyltransferase
MRVELREASPDHPAGVEEILADLGPGESGFGGTAYGEDGFDLHAYLASVAGMKEKDKVRPGLVPQTTFWVLTPVGRIVGVVRLRHELSPSLTERGGHIGYYIRKDERRKGYGTEALRQALRRARELGIDRALVTTDSGNVGSVRAIRRCGGVLEDERVDVSTGRTYGRYWIAAGSEVTEARVRT